MDADYVCEEGMTFHFREGHLGVGDVHDDHGYEICQSKSDYD